MAQTPGDVIARLARANVLGARSKRLALSCRGATGRCQLGIAAVEAAHCTSRFDPLQHRADIQHLGSDASRVSSLFRFSATLQLEPEWIATLEQLLKPLKSHHMSDSRMLAVSKSHLVN